MDPMDYTMDDQAGPSSPTGAPPAFHCQNQLPSAAPNFSPHHRDNLRYDPVHDSTGWFHNANNTSSMSRPLFSPTQDPTQWSSPSFSPMYPSFQAFTDLQRAASQSSDLSSFRQPSAFSDMPWNGAQGFAGYRQYINPTEAAPTPSQHPDPGSAVTGPAAPRSPFGRGGQMSISRRNRTQAEAAMNASAMLSRPVEETPFDRSARYHHTLSLPIESRTEGQARNVRPNLGFRADSPADGPPRRRPVNTWDSDDDESQSPEAEMYSEIRRRHPDFLSEGFGGERSLAAMRGAMAAGKRVPSKEAIASLEEVKVENLTASERTCIICYNEFGIENPEGLTEKPLRLPKCKHLFGDLCIKKWFEDSDSCPYCRDKLPSELSIKKAFGSEVYRAARERLQYYNQVRSRGNLASRPDETRPERSFPEAGPRPTFDDHEYLASPWGLAQQSRSPTSDTPERRRQARGRNGGTRTAHQFGRPTSVGSAIALYPTFNPQSPAPQVPNYSAAISAQPVSLRPRRSVTPGLQNRGSVGNTVSSTLTPPRNGLPIAFGSPSSSSETLSPANAVGTRNADMRNNTSRPGQASARHSIDATAHSLNWNPNLMLLSQHDSTRHAQSSSGLNTLGQPSSSHIETNESDAAERHDEAMDISPITAFTTPPRWSR